MNWTAIWNRLWEIIDTAGDCYFSGPRFLRLVNELTLDLPPYGEFIDQRRADNKSTSRRAYFRDVVMDLNEPVRIRVLRRFIEEA